MDYSLLSLATVARSIGRGVAMYADEWDRTTDLELDHLGDTEGEFVFTPNESFVYLTTEELTGQAPLEGYKEGEAPTITIPFWNATPALKDILSADASASGGYSRQQPVQTYTLVIFPERLFFNSATRIYDAQVRYTNANGWQKNVGAGWVSLTAEEDRYLNLSLWCWRVHPKKPDTRYRHAEAGKVVEPVEFVLMQNVAMPDGHILYTVGDPIDAGIGLEATVSP